MKQFIDISENVYVLTSLSVTDEETWLQTERLAASRFSEKLFLLSKMNLYVVTHLLDEGVVSEHLAGLHDSDYSSL